MFIYDMAGSQYTNFELDLSKKILNLLKVVPGGQLVSGDSVGATRSPGTHGAVVLASICTPDHAEHVSAPEHQLQPPGAREGTGILPGWAGPWLRCRAGGTDQLSPGWIPLTAAGSTFGKTDANYFLIVLAFGASSLLRKKKKMQ